MPLSQESKIVIMGEIDRLGKQKKLLTKKKNILDKELKKLKRQETSIDADIAKLQTDFDNN